MSETVSLEALIEALRCLPGVGQKSAQRMAFHLLQNDRAGAQRLSKVLEQSLQGIRHCQRCNTLTPRDLCFVCEDASRDASLLCVVETPADQAALERTGTYRGLYFVLMGRLNPLEGVGAHAIGIAELMARVQDPSLREVILATSFTAEGEATAQALIQAIHQSVNQARHQMAGSPEDPEPVAPRLAITRLAKGVPVGSELEYVDLSTIAHALALRR